jgi:hypothetical protein
MPPQTHSVYHHHVSKVAARYVEYLSAFVRLGHIRISDQLENLIGTAKVKIYLQNDSQIVIMADDAETQKPSNQTCKWYGKYSSNMSMVDEVIAERRSSPRG